MKQEYLDKIVSRDITVGVIGLGYVGLPLAVEKAKAGFITIGFDIQQEKVDMVNAGVNYIGDVVGNELEQLVQAGKLSATNNFEAVAQSNFIAICVPTPLDRHQQPYLNYIKDSCTEIAKFLKRGSVIVLESTTYPGTTEELVRPILEQISGLQCGTDFYLGFSPERVDPGNLFYKIKNTPKVVGAIGQDALEVIKTMYETVLESEVFTVSSPAVAEMEKILENTYRNVNIGLINEMAMLCHRMNINLWEVIEAAKTKPFGFQAFYPGSGLGGHCIPLDPYYLSWKAREYGFHTSMIESSMMINDRMPEYCVSRMSAILNRAKKPLNGSKILILGVAYKQDVADYRESPALRVIDLLRSQQADVSFYDPYIQEYAYKGASYKGEPELSAGLLRRSDLVVITTMHQVVDYGFVARNAKLIFDTKNAMKNIMDRHNIEVL